MRIQFVSLLLALTALAGCTSDAPDADDTEPTPQPEPETPDYDPAPTGSELSSQDIQELALVFNDEPLTGGQEPWPSHLLKWINDDVFVLLHFDDEDPLQATQMLWYGIGVRGVFCSEDQPGAEFTHFHQRDAPTYSEGHGGEAGEDGYWLLHNNVRQFDSPFGDTGAPGHHEQFGPTPAPDCGDDYEPAAFDPTGSDALDAVEIAALEQVFDDKPLDGGQGESPWPSHLLKWVTEETFVLLHFDAVDPMDATKINWVGIGTRGVFCADDQPGPEFTHFHRAKAPTYAEGHGGEPEMPGYWLLHVATHDFESPFGATGGPGIHHEFGPTPAPAC